MNETVFASVLVTSVFAALATMTVLPRQKPDPLSSEPPPPVETVIVREATDQQQKPQDKAEEPAKLKAIEDKVRAIQVKLNRIERKAEAKE